MSAPSRTGRAARRILFVSSVVEGGSAQGQRDLAALLAAAGREVTFLVDAGAGARSSRRVLAGLEAARDHRLGTRLARPADAIRRQVGARTSTRTIDGIRHEVTIAPEHAFEALLRRRRTDVVVVSSITRPTWRSVRASCRRRAIPTALYLREPTEIGHLAAGLGPDLLMTDSGSLVEAAERCGYPAVLVPSMVAGPVMTMAPTREVALMLDPRPGRGVGIVGPLATARPDIPLVLQETRQLSRRDRLEVERLARDHPNVTFRAHDPRAELNYRDARLLLVPLIEDARPRSVAEAQSLGLPVIATALPGLAEAVGAGGRLIAADAPTDAWVRALGDLWDEDREWMRLSDLARVEAGDPTPPTAALAARFGELVDALVGEGAQKSSMSPSAKRN